MVMFSLLGLCALLGAKSMLLTKIVWFRDCTGVSGKTQILYAMIFASKYLDIVTSMNTYPISITMTKVTFTALTYCIVLSIYFFYRESYQSKYDKFRIELLILPCLVLALLANYGADIVDVFWAFGVYLESVAILPQTYMVSRAKRVESIVYYYVSLLSIYKILVLMDLIYRFYLNQQNDKISLAAGVVQLMFYCDFFMREHPIGDDVEAQDKPVELSEADLRKAAKEAEAARSAAQQPTRDAAVDDRLPEIVMTPSELRVDREQVNNVTPGEPEAKTTSDAPVRA